jgi:hypothetical protein
MARPTVEFTEYLIAKRWRQGYGQLIDGVYKCPWFTVRDFSSKGVTTRFPSFEFGRTLLFFSNIETAAFQAAMRRGAIAYYEQMATDRAETLDIANELGVRHPCYLGTCIPVVMTLDALAVFPTANGVNLEILDSKPFWLLDTPRVREKMAILKVYADRHGYAYRRFTERSISRQELRSLNWMRSAFHWDGDEEHAGVSYEDWSMRLYKAICEDHAAGCQTPVRDYAYQFDVRKRLPDGVGLRCLKLLLLHRVLDFNLSVPHLLMLQLPLTSLQIPSMPAYCGSSSLPWVEAHDEAN